jgi:hypothetical protein
MQEKNSEKTEALKDARPVLPVSDGSLWNKAGERRDEIAFWIEKKLATLGLQAWVPKSQPGEYPLFVAVDIWRNVAETSVTSTFDRSNLVITIHVEPFRQRPIIYTAELSRRKKKYSSTYWNLPHDQLDEMVSYLVQGGRKPTYFKSRIPFLWSILKEYENELVPEAKPKVLTGPTVAGLVGLLAALGGFFLPLGLSDSSDYSDDNMHAIAIGVGIIGLAILGFAIWLGYRRPIYQAVAKQPMRTPRREYVVDSWQVSVPEAGREFEDFKGRIVEALQKMDPGLEFSKEKYQSLTPRGFEERERLVITKGQGDVHVHVQPFGRDAFVGWDSYLNWARWSETAPVSTVVREGNRIEYKSVNAGTHVPSKFDLMELSALAETTHRNIVREIKGFLKEKEIEADLDFQIIRGDRNRALTEGNEQGKNENGKNLLETGGPPPGFRRN